MIFGLLKPIEENVLTATEPVHTDEIDELEVFGERGIWLNKSEEINWKGELPLSAYPLNEV